MVLYKIPDTGSDNVCGTKSWAIDTCIVRYYYRFYTGQRPKIPDSPVKLPDAWQPYALIWVLKFCSCSDSIWYIHFCLNFPIFFVTKWPFINALLWLQLQTTFSSPGQKSELWAHGWTHHHNRNTAFIKTLCYAHLLNFKHVHKENTL